jgi:hypothetical protein
MNQLSAPHEVEAARERVVRLLTDRYADDSLTLDAFEARLDALHQVSDVAALDAMAASLAVPAHRQAVPTATGRQRRRSAARGAPSTASPPS